MDILITANSPGEVYGWLRPVIDALSRRLPDARLVVVVPPCTFAAGTESQVVRTLPGVFTVIESDEYLKWAIWGRTPHNYRPASQGLVLFLGGDLAHAVILAKRLKWPAMAYTEGMVHWPRAFARFMVPYSSTADMIRRQGVPDEKVRIIGNLMVDGITYRLNPGELRGILGAPKARMMAVFPGSRPFEVRYLAGFFLRVAELAAQLNPGLVVVYSLAPFITPEMMANSLRNPLPLLEVSRGEMSEAGLPNMPPGARLWRVHSEHGLSAWVMQGLQYDLMREADLALNLPGTNNLEMAAVGLPMVVTLPLNKPDEIPIEGILEFIGRIPVIGKRLKRKAVLEGVKRMGFISWPNRLAQRMIAREMIGTLTAAEIAAEATGLLRDEAQRKEISLDLRQVAGTGGAAAKLVGEIVSFMER